MDLRYILKRIKAEWQSNIWLSVELLIVSVIIWIMVDQLYVHEEVRRESKGFDITDTFLVDISEMSHDAPEYDSTYKYQDSEAYIDAWREMIERLRRRPEVEYVGQSLNAYPYNGSNSANNLLYVENGDTLLNRSTMMRYVSPDFLKVFRYRGANGETPEELAAMLEKNPQGIMVSSNFTDGKTIRTDVIGNDIEVGVGENAQHKIVGIYDPVKYTEYSMISYSTSYIESIYSDKWLERAAREITVRVKEGMSKDFIENLMVDADKQFRVGNFYIANVESFKDKAANYERGTKSALRNKLIIITFLLVNVFLGLFGTFWFRTRQRYPEIALMKVAGATGNNVAKSLIVEGLMLLTLVTPIAAIIDINLAVFELNMYGNGGYLEWTRMISCILGVYAVMAVIIIVAVAIPSRKAVTLDPATALHDE